MLSPTPKERLVEEGLSREPPVGPPSLGTAYKAIETPAVVLIIFTLIIRLFPLLRVAY